MNLYRIIFLFIFVTLSVTSFAQHEGKPEHTKLNQLDKKGARHGLWLNTVEPRMGEAGYNEFGTYYHGWKNGIWYKMNREGDLVAIENFRNNVLDGEVKYFTRGQLTCIGHYRGLNPDRKVDTIMVEDPVTGRQQLVEVSAERGTVRHGKWNFYDGETGRLIKVEEYQVDNLIFEKEYTLSKADSLFYERRAKSLPHKKKTESYYRPPAEKQVRYTR